MMDTVKETFGIKSAKEYNELLSDRDNLRKQLDASQADFATLQKSYTEQTEKINAFAKVEEDYKNQIEELKATNSQQQTTLQAKAEEEKNSAETKAQAIVASMGVSEDAKLPKVTEQKTAYETFKSLSGMKQQEYFKKHKDAIYQSRPQQVG